MVGSTSSLPSRSLLLAAETRPPPTACKGRGRAWALTSRKWLSSCLSAELGPPRRDAPWPIGDPCASPSTNGAALQYRVPLPRVAVRPGLGAAAGTHSNSGAGDGGREGPKWPHRRQVRGARRGSGWKELASAWLRSLPAGGRSFGEAT